MGRQPVGVGHVGVERPVGHSLPGRPEKHQAPFPFGEKRVFVVLCVGVAHGCVAVFRLDEVLDGVASTVVVGLTPHRFPG